VATRYNTTAYNNGSLDLGYSGEDIPDDFHIPPCNIEDVDRALFNFFNEELPLFYKRRKETKRVPVIFATGERFAILARNKPLRDKSGAIILPLISILRSGIDQSSAKGATHAQLSPLLIKVRLSKSDPRYQRLQNRWGFDHSDSIAIAANEKTASGLGGGTSGGRIATRREAPAIPISTANGVILKPNTRKNIIEFIEIPPIKQYTANYEITFWTQYTQEMNSLLTTMMGGYTQNSQRTFLITTKVGYKFTAFIDANLSPSNNFEDFSDDERLVKYSFTVAVPAYVVAPQEIGLPVPFRRIISAPDISFGVSQLSANMNVSAPSAVPSGEPGQFILEDIDTDAMGIPGQAMPRGMNATLTSGFPGATAVISNQVTIGSTDSDSTTTGASYPNRPKVIVTKRNPFTGKDELTQLNVLYTNNQKGETVFRASTQPSGGLSINLGDLFKD
jgi:hypothetical protein